MVALRPRPSLDWCLPTHPSSCESTAAASPVDASSPSCRLNEEQRKFRHLVPFPSFPILSASKLRLVQCWPLFFRGFHGIPLTLFGHCWCSENLHLVGFSDQPCWGWCRRKKPSPKWKSWTRCGVASYVTPIFRLVTVSGTLKHHQIPPCTSSIHTRSEVPSSIFKHLTLWKEQTAPTGCWQELSPPSEDLYFFVKRSSSSLCSMGSQAKKISASHPS